MLYHSSALEFIIERYISIVYYYYYYYYYYNIAINLSKAKKNNNKLKAQLHHLNNHSFNITHLDLATQMK